MKGIWDVLSGSAAAAWVEAIGTVVAAAIVVGIYYKGRHDQRQDLAQRRKVVRAMLVDRVAEAATQARSLADTVPRLDIENDPGVLNSPHLELVGVSRLVDLQSQVASFGEVGDVAIASFVESCSIYDDELRRCRVLCKHDNEPVLSRVWVLGLGEAAARMYQRAYPAVQAIGMSLDEIKRLRLHPDSK